MLKITVTPEILEEVFRRCGRDCFSISACEALVQLHDYLDCDDDEELDPIALCCEYTEYEPLELITEFGYILDEESEKDEFIEVKAERIAEKLDERTFIYGMTNGNYLVRNF